MEALQNQPENGMRRLRRYNPLFRKQTEAWGEKEGQACMGPMPQTCKDHMHQQREEQEQRTEQ